MLGRGRGDAARDRAARRRAGGEGAARRRLQAAHVDVEMVARYADILQLGTRNMQNYALLQEAGRSGKPVLLKRGMSSTVEEWLLAAEYVLSQGNRGVILCERGIRT